MSDTSGSVGYGQWTPFDGNNEVAAIMFVCRQIVAELHTAKLVKVIAVHPGEAGDNGVPAPGTVDVQPLVSQIDGGGFATPHGTVYGIPFARPGGSLGQVASDPQPGDIGQVVACDRDISSAKKNLAVSTPASFRKFDIADGIYAGCILGAEPTQALFFSDSGVKLLDKSGNALAMTGDGTTLTPASGKPFTVGGDEVVTGDGHVEGAMKVDGALDAGSMQVASGAVLTRVLAGSTTTDFGGSIAPTLTLTASASVPGAVVGDAVLLGYGAAGPGFAAGVFSAYVSAPDIVTLQVTNPFTTGGAQPIASATYFVLVFGHS